MRLLAAMIVRDELDRYLPEALDRLLDFCDEVVVFDDGSADRTGDWLAEYTLRKRRRILQPRSSISVWDRLGEGAARQKLLDYVLAFQPAPDWALSIDADEIVSDGQALRSFLERHDPFEVPAAVSLTMREVWERETHLHGYLDEDPEEIEVWQVRVDGGWAPREVPVVWTPPHRKLSSRERWEYGWTIPNRRLACGREPECVRLLDAVPSGVDLLHLGWSDPAEREARVERYMRIDGGRFHASEHLRSILGREPELKPYLAPR
jgi:glycosyltransferase involved in cell wall biosynthesis